MSLILRSNLTRPLTHDELDGNLVYLNIAEWVKKGYTQGQFVLIKRGAVAIVYYCEMTHTDFIYNKYGAGNFLETYVEGTKLNRLWRQIGTSGDGGYVTIQKDGVPLIQRSVLNVIGDNIDITDDPVNGQTILTVDGSGITGFDFNGTITTIELRNGDLYTIDLNEVQISGSQYSVGISNHSYQLITTDSADWVEKTINGDTYNVHGLIFGSTKQPAKQNIVVIDLYTHTNIHHLIQLPEELTVKDAGVMYKIITKSSYNTNLNKYLMIFSSENRIISANIKTIYNNNYFLPLETMESVEIIWDGYDYLITNMVKQGYVSLNAKNFIEMDPNVDPLFNTCYIQRDINEFL